MADFLVRFMEISPIYNINNELIMMPEDKVIEIFCLADDFCKYFSSELKKNISSVTVESTVTNPANSWSRGDNNSLFLLLQGGRYTKFILDFAGEGTILH